MFTSKARVAIATLIGIIFLLLCTSRTAPAQEPCDSTGKSSDPLKTERIDPKLLKLAQSFSALSREEFLNWLQIVEPQAANSNPDDQAKNAATELLNAGEKIIEDGDSVYHLSERTRPVLQLFHREAKTRFIVVEAQLPSAETDSGGVIIISTGLLAEVDNDVQLDGVVAHELAHELFRTERLIAFKHHDLETMRLGETQCDMVAALALRALNMDASETGKLFYKMAAMHPDLVEFNDGTDDHPSFWTRIRLNELVSKGSEKTATAGMMKEMASRAETRKRYALRGAQPRWSHVNPATRY